MDKLLKMCRIFDCSLDDLVQGDLTKEREGNEGALILFALAGVLGGLAFLIPAGMAHSAFVKAHPFVEDFYTEEDRSHARTAFSRGLVGGIAAIFVGFGIFLIIGESEEGYALFFLLLFIALGVWSIIRYGMLLGRTNVAEYNRNSSDDLEIEDIMSAQIKEEVRESLLRKRKRGKKLGAVCGAIMIAATIIGLALLFAPVLASPDPSNFKPEGTSAMWFWAAWPVDGMVCGIVSLLWEAFGKEEH